MNNPLQEVPIVQTNKDELYWKIETSKHGTVCKLLSTDVGDIVVRTGMVDFHEAIVHMQVMSVNISVNRDTFSAAYNRFANIRLNGGGYKESGYEEILFHQTELQMIADGERG